MLRSDSRAAAGGQEMTSGALVEGGLTDTVGTVSFTPNAACKSGLNAPQHFLGPSGYQK
jgi:hypothetical protein